MTNLEKNYQQEVTLRNLSPKTQKSYWCHIQDYQKFVCKDPQTTGIKELRSYFQFLLSDGVHKPGNIKMGYFALRFLFVFFVLPLVISELKR